MFKTIVVGTDGSTEAGSALAAAANLAEQDNARLIVIHVQEFVGGKGGRYPLHVDEDEILTGLRASVSELAGRGIAAELDVQQIPFGGPAHVIADAAAKADADLIIVGNKGRNPVSEIVLGNVPIRLLHIAHRPVMVIPATDRSTAGTSAASTT
jgi:nucleotide-binding universal stress UspA family protein